MKNNKVNMDSITVPENVKRRASKLSRNKGLGAIEKAKSNPVAWNQARDPLFKVKGKERNSKRRSILITL